MSAEKILIQLIFTATLLFDGPVYGQQDSANWTLRGYLGDLQMVQFSRIESPWITGNEFHNRLDFGWNPGTHFGMGAGMRNRFLFGQTLTQNPEYKSALVQDPGLVNMTWDIASGNSYAIVSQFDRAWISWSGKGFQMTAGRQRINWGQAVVWNPNDLFNAYSYYDIDYPERPGSDAIRGQIFPSSTSAIEMVSKWNSEGRITIAGLGRFNAGGYDIQFLAGLVDDRDYVAGAGWSGNLAGAAFRGEVNYYHPKKYSGDTTGVLLATFGVDYAFANSLLITFQALYNQLPEDYLPENLANIYQAPASPKTLSFAEWNLFLSATCPVTPIFDVTLAGMYFPDLQGYFLGPNLNYSLKTNVDLSLFIQYFDGRFKIPGFQPPLYYDFQSFMGAVRLKWNF